MVVPFRKHVAYCLGGLAPALLVLGCAGAHSEVVTGLSGAGVPTPLANCMAAHLVEGLSAAQLRRTRLIGLGGHDRTSPQSIEQFWQRIRALDDDDIFYVATAATLTCSNPLNGPITTTALAP